MTRSNDVPSCPFCGSCDTDHPYRRPSRIPVLTRVFPRLRLWYCRRCTRLFPIILRRRPVEAAGD